MLNSVRQVVNQVYSSNTYILSGGDPGSAWLVDIGDFESVLNEIPQGTIIKGLLLTHTHFDHIFSINKLVDCFPSCLVCVSGYGNEALYSDKKNLSFYHHHPVVFSGQNTRILHEKDELHILGDQAVEIYETPGHEPGCLTYRIGRYLFTGDSYIPGVKVVTNLPKGDKNLAAHSLGRILNLIDKQTLVCAGHGKIKSYKELEINRG